jgi:hypothetical protein
MRKRIRRRIRHQGEGVNIAADVDGVISVNRGSSQSQSVSVKSHSTVVQRGGRKAGDSQGADKQSNQEEGR